VISGVKDLNMIKKAIVSTTAIFLKFRSNSMNASRHPVRVRVRVRVGVRVRIRG
jgi:hypothetical protein